MSNTANIIITITKSSPDEVWIALNDRNFVTNNFTQSEIKNIMDPYFKFRTSLPGFQSDVPNKVDDITMDIIITFDTLENAQNGMQQLAPPYANNSIQEIFYTLISNKRKEFGVNYTVTTRIEE